MALWGKKTDQESQRNATPGIVGATEAPAQRSDFKGLFERKGEVNAQAAVDRYGKVRSALDGGTVIQGKLTFDTPVRIDGKLTGEIFSSSTLIIGPTGVVDATVEVASLVVLGSLKGSVKVSDRIEVYSHGSVEGSLTTPVLVVEQGCTLNGECKMPEAPKAKSPESDEGGVSRKEGQQPGDAGKVPMPPRMEASRTASRGEAPGTPFMKGKMGVSESSKSLDNKTPGGR